MALTPCNKINDKAYKIIKESSANTTFQAQLSELNGSDGWGSLTQEEKNSAILILYTGTSPSDNVYVHNVVNSYLGTFARISVGSSSVVSCLFGLNSIAWEAYQGTNNTFTITNKLSTNNPGKLQLCVWNK